MNRNIYKKFLTIHGSTERERLINHTKLNIIANKNSLPSAKEVIVNDEINKTIFIHSTNANNVKNFNTLPNEKLNLGDIIVWNNMHWLVTSIDFDDELTMYGEIKQCNRVIKWQNTKTLEIIESWCFCSKPYTSNIDEGNVLSVLNGKYNILLPYNDETKLLNVDKRLMLDVVDGVPKVYKIEFADTNTNVYDDVQGGFIEWTIGSDVYVKDKDNVDLMICDYISNDNKTEDSNAELLNCNILGRDSIKIGTKRIYKSKFYDGDNNIINDISPIWDVVVDTDEIKYEVDDENNLIVICNNNTSIIGKTIKIILKDDNEKYNQCELCVKVVSMFG